MQHVLKIYRFGWPYLRKYRGRLFIGIILGLIFGATNVGFVWLSTVLTRRLDNKPTAAVVEVQKTDGKVAADTWLSDARRTMDSLKLRVEQKSDALVDDWLPRAGRSLDASQVVGVLLILPLMMALRGFTGYFSSYCLVWVSERVVHDLRMQVISKIQGLSLEFFNRAKMGDLITRVNGDTSMLQRTLSLVFSDLIKEPATILAVFVGMVIIDWQISLFVMLFLPLCVLPLIVFGKKVKRAMEGNIAASISQSSLLIEAASGIRVVKAFNLEEQQRQRFEALSRQIVHHNMKSTQARELVNPCIETISMVGLALLIIFIFYSNAALAELVGLVASVAILFTPIKKLGRVHVFIQQTSVGVERLFALFAEKPAVDESSGKESLSGFNEEIALRDVSFSYLDDVVLKNISLAIPRGHKLGIAGESGSGKSTLINLLLRFYDPTEGRLEIDGTDFRSVQASALREQIALVSQDVVVFDMSIAKNIACGRKNATREEIEQAASDAFAHEFILQLPDGYDTEVGERGVTLSGGQRQRLAIARAFVKNAPILLLDEATAALDSKTEAEVQKAIEKLEENRTVVCIAHRLSTLANMDQILVLAAGEIVESGGFSELLRANGEFAAMAQRQGIHQKSDRG